MADSLPDLSRGGRGISVIAAQKIVAEKKKLRNFQFFLFNFPF